MTGRVPCLSLLPSASLFRCALLNSKFQSSFLSPALDEIVDAPIPRAVRREKEKDKAQEHSGFPMVLYRPDTIGLMKLEISDRHLSRKNECNRLRKQSDQDRCPTVKFEHATDPYL